MIDSMVERVARALCLCACDVNEFPCPQRTPCTEWREYLYEARAAIEAMRTPTPAMIDEGGTELMAYEPDADPCDDAAVWVWEAMITAALDDGTGPIPIYSGKPKE